MVKTTHIISVVTLLVMLSGCATQPTQQSQPPQHLEEICKFSGASGSAGYNSCIDEKMKAFQRLKEYNFDLNNRIAQQQEIEKKQAEQDARAKELLGRCQVFGFQIGTSAMSQCLYQQQQIEIQNRATAESLRIQQQQIRIQQMQQGLQMLNPPKPANPAINCLHIPGSVITTCQ
jgi:hypothetical protein